MVMKKIYCLLISLLLLTSLSWSAQWVELAASPEPVAVKLLESSDSRIQLNYQLNGFERDEVIINGETYAVIGLDSESRLWLKGNPELPRLCRSVIIPDDGFMEASVISSQYREFSNIKIAPSKGHLLRSVNPDDVPYEFGEVYQEDAWYPEKIVELREPYILRDLRGQVVEVNAFQYNPVKQVLRVYTEITVQVDRVGSGGENVFVRTKPLEKMDPEFRRIYQRHFLNFDLVRALWPERYDPVEEVGPMLVITYDDFYDAVMPLVDWKNQKGIPTIIENVSVIGNNATDIKNYIRNLYETDGLTFVLLVGDAAQVATPSGGEDPTYAQLVGSDHYPELFVGRFSAETVGQAYTQVERTINYEKFPQAAADWYHKGAGVASNQGAGMGHYGESDDEHMDYIRDDLLDYTYTEVDRIYDPYGTSGMVSTALNEGRSTINYCGHGSTTSWGSTGFNVSNVNNLVNDNMLPFNTTVACLCGNFANSTCFAEAWLRATHDGEPTGAIGFFASTISQSWAPPMYAQDEFIDLMCADLFHSYGALCFNGTMLMIDETGSTGESEADHWTIFGDPSFQVRTDTPFDMSVSHNNSIDPSQNVFDVVVTGIEGALAAISFEGDLLGCAYTNASGLAPIPITPGTLPPGYVDLTVTSYNAMPYITQLPVVPTGPDTWPPLIAHVPLENTTSSGPYTVSATIMDYSGVAEASVFYSTDGINFDEVAMTNTGGDTWEGDIPGQPVATVIDYYIEAVDASPQSNAGTSDTFSFTILGVLFSDDMESGAGGWTHAEVTPGWIDQWHMSTANSHSGTHAWRFGDTGTGNYANSADGGLISQVISIGSECELSFWHWIAAEASGAYPDSAYDGGVVEISHNGGPWAVLECGYTHTVRSTAGGGNPYTGPFAPETPLFSGSSNWAQKSADLSAYIGDIQLRFRFGSDAAANDVGWFIDDVEIIGLPTGTTPDVVVELTPYGTPIQIPATGGSFDFNIAVTNNEASAQTFDVWCDVTLPGGTIYGPVIGPVNLTLGAGVHLDRDRSQAVPGGAPSGDYTYNAYVGVNPGVVWSADTFPFTKLTTGNGNPVPDWDNWGESFEDWFTTQPERSEMPESFSFEGIYPNPFNPVTQFSFVLPEASRVSLKVYNLQGRLVATLADGMRDAGTHEVTFDASNLASGIYLYRLTAGTFNTSGKMALVK